MGAMGRKARLRHNKGVIDSTKIRVSGGNSTYPGKNFSISSIIYIKILWLEIEIAQKI